MGRQKRLATIDAETDPFEFGKVPAPFLWVYHDDEETVKFWGKNCTRQLFDHIKNKNRMIYAHNGGKFDFFFFLEHLVEEVEPKMINGRIVSMDLGMATLRDSYSLLPVPLKQINKDEIEIEKMHRNLRDQHREEITRYCVNDCRYLLDAVEKFTKMYGNNLTLAGTAFKFWKKKNPKAVKMMRAPTDAKFRPFYYGGRTEAIEHGVFDGDFKYYDVNSMYPWAMGLKHPAGTQPIKLKTLDFKFIEQSFFKIRAKSFGALPFRDEKGALRFPRDGKERIYHATGWEVKTGLETNTLEVKEILEQYYFKETVTFGDYIQHFFDMKAEAKRNDDKFKYMVSKLMMNSLYGKFAQDSLKFKDVVLGDPISKDLREMGWAPGEMVNPNIRIFSKPSHYIQEDGTWNKEPKFNNVATASSITGCCRALLWRSILKTEKPVYCDTDSIICADGSALPVSENLGDWEIEGDNITKVAVAGKKMYATFQGEREYKIASKGARLTATQILRIAQGEEITYRFDAPTFRLGNTPQFVERKIRATF